VLAIGVEKGRGQAEYGIELILVIDTSKLCDRTSSAGAAFLFVTGLVGRDANTWPLIKEAPTYMLGQQMFILLRHNNHTMPAR
jgi:hypothetical protein